MRILVCGGRNYADKARMFATLDGLCAQAPYGTFVVIQGGATGADALAREWAYRQSDNIHSMVNMPADWRKHGRAAGPIRNHDMLNQAAPSHVLAFPGGNGTADMVRRARAASIPVIEVPAHVH